jgi:succinylarginine dihydrolase
MSLISLPAVEVHFDGLVGPTHLDPAFATADRAAARNARQRSNPREAALQGLAKMRALVDLGLPQGVLPPQERPYLPALRARDWRGRDAELLDRARREEPERLAQIGAASSLRAANAATVSPAADCTDGRVHFTPANLVAQPHRALETPTTARLLATLFRDPAHFAHHAPLTPDHADEGAANQLRLCASHGAAGVELFVYGRERSAPDDDLAQCGRQVRTAGEQIAEAHGLQPARVLHVRQDPRAIAAGAVHADAVALSHHTLLLHHEQAFADGAALRRELALALGPESRAQFVSVRDAELSLEEAVASTLFNSQLLDHPDGGLWLLCATAVREHERAWRLVEQWIADPSVPIRGAQVVDLRHATHGRGGPACLRLRVVLTPAQHAAVHAPCWLTAERHTELDAWVKQHYRDRLAPADLADPQLLDESRTALDRLTRLLALGSFYDFQR